MEELIELKEKTEKEISEMYQVMQNIKTEKEYQKRYLDKIDFLKLINIIIKLK